MAGNAAGDLREVLAARRRDARGDATGLSYWEIARRRFVRHRLAMAGGAVAVLLSVVALLSPWISPYPFDRLDLRHRKAAPAVSHPFGTDELGRDALTRVMHAGRVSLVVGYVTAVNVAVVGTVAGARGCAKVR